MYEVIMESYEIGKYFYISRDEKTYPKIMFSNYILTPPQTKEIHKYYGNIKIYENVLENINYNICLRYFSNFEEYDINFIFNNTIANNTERLVFEFETEEEAFYFKLKFL